MSALSRDQWKVLSPHLEEALDMTERERSVWLSGLRSRNPALAYTLEMLLNEHRVLSEEGFLEKRSFHLPKEHCLAGQTVGMYTLVSQIGRGGMGSVWLAERCDGRFQRQVAIKFLNIGFPGRDGERRFKREGNILARLAHPNIAQLIDAGVSSTGQPYLVLEYVEAEHIDQYCDQRKIAVEARVRLFLEVLKAVSHAHRNLIVHRDIKPSNVMVRNDGQVKLLDFGIAKLLSDQGEGEEATLITLDGVRPMTPEYAAPEQLQGGAVTTSTDVYALGVLLYVLLTGHHPLGDGTHSPADLVKAVVDKEATRPSDVVVPTESDEQVATTTAARRATTPEKLRRLLRGDLDTIVARALKKEPSERYPSVTALADDLRRYLRSEPISARPDTFVYRAAKFARRNRAVVALASLAVIATAAGLMGTLIQWHAARAQRDFALRLLGRAERLNSLNELLLTDVAPLGKQLTANELLEREEHIVEREHYEDAANHVELLISIGGQYSGAEENVRAVRVLEQAYDLSRRIEDRSTRAKASCELAWALLPGGELARAESLVREGLLDLPPEPQFNADRVRCLLRGADVAFRNGDASEYVARARAAELALQQSPVRPPVEELEVLTEVANAYSTAGQFRESNAAFERASARLTDLGYDETQKAVKLFNDWGFASSNAGRPLDAEKAYRRAIEISRNSESEDAVLPTLLYNYSIVLRDLARIPEALDYVKRAHQKAVEANNQMLVAQTNLQLARICRDQHDFERASAILAELEPSMRRTLPPGHYAFASLTSDKALLAQAQGDLPTALQLANQAVAMDESAIKAGGQGAIYLPLLLVRRSALELASGKADLAAADATRALDLLRTNMQAGSLSSNMGRAYLALARAQQAQGKSDEARAAFRSAAENLQASVGPDHQDTRTAVRLAKLDSSRL